MANWLESDQETQTPDEYQAIEVAFRPGAFIRDGECFSFVSGLEEVAAIIDKLVATEPARAVARHRWSAHCWSAKFIAVLRDPWTVFGRLLPVKVESNHRVHLGQSKSWLFSLDLFRTAPVEEGMDNRIDRDAGGRNSGPEQGPSSIHQSRIWTSRGEHFDYRTMPNTMPGFCIEALRPVATPQLDFTTNLFSGGNM